MFIKIYKKYPSLQNPIGETLITNKKFITHMQNVSIGSILITDDQYYKSQNGYAGDRRNINALLKDVEIIKRKC